MARGSVRRLKEGEFRLLILSQQQGNSHGCVSAAPGAATFEQRVPLLTGPDDPLVAVIETLIQVADSRSRRERATLLVERLADAHGLSAVPFLSSLRLRADWAAVDQRGVCATGSPGSRLFDGRARRGLGSAPRHPGQPDHAGRSKAARRRGRRAPRSARFGRIGYTRAVGRAGGIGQFARVAGRSRLAA